MSVGFHSSVSAGGGKMDRERFISFRKDLATLKKCLRMINPRASEQVNQLFFQLASCYEKLQVHDNELPNLQPTKHEKKRQKSLDVKLANIREQLISSITVINPQTSQRSFKGIINIYK